MKKQVLSAALGLAIVGLSSGSVFAAPPTTGDGTIIFNGEVTETTCSIHGGSAANPIGDFTVNLKQVSVDTLNGGAGKTAVATPFEIVLGASGETNCDNGSKLIGIRFEPTVLGNIDTASGALSNTSTDAGKAAGVGIQILDSNSQAIDLNSGDITGGQVINATTSNTATYNYFAQYISLADTVSAGPVQSSIVYTVVYE